MNTRQKLTKPVLIAAAAALAVSLAGCFSNPVEDIVEDVTGGVSEESSEGATEKLVEGMTGTEVDIETGGELPADFPSEVPLPVGTIDTAVGSEVEAGKVWGLTYLVDDPAAALADLRGKMADAGFEEHLWNETENSVTAGFGNGTYVVTVGTFALDDPTSPLSISVTQSN